jgi:hypothetical protein
MSTIVDVTMRFKLEETGDALLKKLRRIQFWEMIHRTDYETEKIGLLCTSINTKDSDP